MYVCKAVVLSALAAVTTVHAQINYGASTPTTTANIMAAAVSSSSSAAAPSMSGVHTVQVSSSDGTMLAFNPSSLTAAMGDKVEFQFWGLNHSVTQASFDKPCEPLAGGFFSGFFPLQAGATDRPSFTITVNSTSPIWFYCGQTVLSHCQAGMVGAINAPSTGNTLSSFMAASKKTSSSMSPPSVQGGIVGKVATNSASSSASGAAAASSSTAASGAASSYGFSAVEFFIGVVMVGFAGLMS